MQAVQDGLWTDPPYPLHLYHYSKLAGIRGILNSRELWLSDIRSMKDPRDGTYWSEVFSKILDHKSVPELVRQPFRCGDGIGIGAAWFSYLICFSPTSALESQWGEYADHGAGCAIEFLFDALLKNANGGNLYAWTPMEYDANVQRMKAEETIDAAIRLYRSERDELTPDEAKIYWTYAAFSFLLCGTRFKHPDYKHEQEWRIFISRPTRDGVNYRIGERGAEIPYMKAPFAPDVVTGLIKGTACNCSDDELLFLLRHGGYGENLRTHEPCR